MLQIIHERLTGPFAIAILAMLAVVFIFWGVDFVSVGSGARATGLSVNGEDVRVEDLRQAYQDELNRYQVAFGDQPMPEEVRKQLQHEVLENTIRRELMRQRADELRLRVSDADVVRSLQDIPAFQVDGKFNKDAYYATLQAQNINPASFEAQQRQQLGIRMLDRGLAVSAFVTPQEMNRLIALRNETRDVAYAVVPVARFLAAVSPDEAALEAYYQQNGRQFMTPEQATVDYVELALADVAAGVAVTDAALRGYYEENKERYVTADRRRASHILVNIDKDEAAAQQQAQQIYERIKAGEDFAALARQYSQDSGSAQQGGDLGWAEKSFFVGPFADAVWSMQVGELRGPVKSEFGFHVIRLDAVEGGHTRSFEEVRAELEGEYRRAQAEKLYGDLEEKLDTDAFESAGNLAQVAKAMALPVKRVETFTRAGGGELGADPKLVNLVFDAEMTAGNSVRTLQLGEGRVLALKVAAYQKPELRPLAEVREQVLGAVRLEQAKQRAAGAASELMKQLQGGGNWAALAAPYAATLTTGTSITARAVKRDDSALPREVVQAVFKSVRPAAAPVYGVASLPNGDAAVWTVTTARPGQPAATDAASRSQLVQQVLDGLRVADFTQYLLALRSGADVESSTKLFE